MDQNNSNTTSSSNQPMGQKKGELSPNIASVLCYVCGLISGVVFLVMDKRKEVRFHALQAIFLWVALVIVFLVVGILEAVKFPYALLQILQVIILIAYLIVWILAMVKAYQGERWLIPGVGKFADKFSK